MKENKNQRDGFSSKLGVILAAAGSAIGIGNIWRFSYVVGANGGGAFLLIYILCVVLVGLPLMMGELAIGRRTQTSAVTAFRKAAPKSFWWIAGALGVLASLLIMTYYPLIAGWSLGYMFESIFSWEAMTTQSQAFFESYTSGLGIPLVMLAIVLVITMFTLFGGVAKGIERFNKIAMPIFIVLLLILIVRSVTLPGAGEGIAFLFLPDFSQIGFGTLLEALGHGFYSLSVGMAIMITYGSYIRKKDDLVDCAVQVCILDTVTALMAGLAIFPAVFALGLEPTSGAGLAFITLPKAFATLPGGQFFAVLFFLLLTVAALASMTSLLQVLVAFLEDQMKIRHKKTMLVIVSAILFLLGIPASLSFGPMADFKILGMTYFEFVDNISANIIVPITGLLTAIFIGFRYLHQSHEEIKQGAKNPNGFLIRTYPVLIKYFVPISIIVILIYSTGIVGKIFG